jgi:hypothetical protein
MYPFNSSISAAQTSGIILPIHCFDILNRYWRLEYESPVARNRRVTANLEY